MNKFRSILLIAPHHPNFCPPSTLSLFLCLFFLLLSVPHLFHPLLFPAPDLNQPREMQQQTHGDQSGRSASLFSAAPSSLSDLFLCSLQLSWQSDHYLCARRCSLTIIVLWRRTLTLCASSMSLTEPENKKIFNYQRGFGGAVSIKM